MSISFRKSLPIGGYDISKANTKQSNFDSDELGVGGVSSNYKTSEDSYAQKIAVRGLSFEDMDAMYLANVWIRAAADRIIERVAGIQPLVKPLNVKVEEYEAGKLPDGVKRNMDRIGELIINSNENMETMTSIRKKFSRDLIKYDAAAIEIVNDIDVGKKQNNAQLYCVAGDQVKIDVNRFGLTKSFKQVTRDMNVVATWDKNEMIYGMLNPQSNKVYGLSPAESLVQTVTAELYTSQYNLDFYYNNATPRFAVLMEGLGIGQGSAALTRFRKWWDDELKGNPHRPIILGTENGKIALQNVGMSNDDMQFQQYAAWLMYKICAIYKIPPIILTTPVDGASINSNTYKEMNNQFNLEAVKPHLTLFSEKMNQQVIFSTSVMDIKDAYLDFDLFVGDKKEQAEVHEMYGRMGVVTINEIRTRGLGLAPVSWGNVPYLQNNLTPFGQGKNGQAVPGNINGTGDGDVSNVPNTAIASKQLLEKYLEEHEPETLGWSNLEIGKRMEIVEELLKEKERLLSKTFITYKN